MLGFTSFFSIFASLMLLLALNGDPDKLTFNTHFGWKAFEVITQGDKSGTGYVVAGEMDGIGAFLKDSDTLRVLINHETGRACDPDTEATVTEVDIDLVKFKSALSNMIRNNNLGGERDFVRRFRRAYDTIVNVNGQEVDSCRNFGCFARVKPMDPTRSDLEKDLRIKCTSLARRSKTNHLGACLRSTATLANCTR